MGLRKHWIAAVGAVGWALSLWNGAIKLLDIAGRADLVMSHLQTLPAIGAALAWVLSPSWGAAALYAAAGSCLIWWDRRREKAVSCAAIASLSPQLTITATRVISPAVATRRHWTIFGLCVGIVVVTAAAAAFYWWKASSPPEVRLLSTWGTQVYACDRTRLDPNIDRPTDLATARARAVIAEDALGIHIEIQEISNGLRLSIVPLTANARRVFSDLPYIQLEERRVGNTLFVTYPFPVPILKPFLILCQWKVSSKPS